MEFLVVGRWNFWSLLWGSSNVVGIGGRFGFGSNGKEKGEKGRGSGIGAGGKKNKGRTASV
jgi:hypothetical protein